MKKAFWALEEVGVPYERVDAGGAFGLVKEEPFLSLNPNGVIPLLQDGDLALWESNAIVRYIAARYGVGTPLGRGRGRARGRQVDGLGHHHLRRAVPRRVLESGARHPAGAGPGRHGARPRRLLRPPAPVSTRRLPAPPILSGESFRMGDIPLGCFAYLWFEMPIERPRLPHLEEWYARIRERPAFKTAVATPLT